MAVNSSTREAIAVLAVGLLVTLLWVTAIATEQSRRTEPIAALDELTASFAQFLDASADDLRLAAALRGLPSGIALIDERGCIRQIDGTIQRLTGFPPDELIGRDYTVLVPPEHRRLHVGRDGVKMLEHTWKLVPAAMGGALWTKGGQSVPGDVRVARSTHDDGRSWYVMIFVAKGSERLRGGAQ